MTSNNELIDFLIQNGSLKTKAIIKAFRAVDRFFFVSEKDKNKAYEDIALGIGYEATISQPSTVAFLLEKLFYKSGDPVKLRPVQNKVSTGLRYGVSPVPVRLRRSYGASKILEIGAGSGYVTALLSVIVGKKGKIFAIDYKPELIALAEGNIKSFQENYSDKENLGDIDLIVSDGKLGLLAEAPFDKILSGASAQELPQAWKEQIKKGGRIVTPFDDSIVVIKKISKDKYKEERYPGFVFVGLQ